MSDYPTISTVSSGWANVYHYPAEFKTTQQLDEEAVSFEEQIVLTFDMFPQAYGVRWESMTLYEKRRVFTAFREAVIGDATTSWTALLGRDDIRGISRYEAAINTLSVAHYRFFRMRHPPAIRQILDGAPVRDFHFKGGNEHMLPVYIKLITRCLIEYCVKTGAKGRDGVPAMFLDFICRPLRRAVSLFPRFGSDVCVYEIMLTMIDLHDTIKQSDGFWYNNHRYYRGYNDRRDSELVARLRVHYGLKPLDFEDEY